MDQKTFRNLLARMRFVNRDDLPATEDWDADWPSFRDNPYRYFLSGPEKHTDDIWNAIQKPPPVHPIVKDVLDSIFQAHKVLYGKPHNKEEA